MEEETKKLKEAINTIIRYIGDDPTRKELLNTADNITATIKNIFSGYNYDLSGIEADTIENESYDEVIILDNIEMISFCQDHFLPFTGKVKIAYIPNRKIIGIGKLIKIVEAFSRKIQESLTIDIANYIDSILKPRGVGVFIEASHACIYLRGNLEQKNYSVKTCHLIGCLKDNVNYRNEFLNR